MTPGTRKALIFAALVATLAAAYFAPSAEVVDVRTVRDAPARSARAEPLPVRSGMAADRETEILAIRPRDTERTEGSSPLFAEKPAPLPARDPGPVISSAPVPVAVPAAQAPPLPFRVIGSYAEDGRTGVFVELEERSVIARIGDTLAGLYRIDALGEGTVTVTYLPLDRQQTVDIGAQVSK